MDPRDMLTMKRALGIPRGFFSSLIMLARPEDAMGGKRAECFDVSAKVTK